ncbi:MAG: hypothetical protein LW855_06530 [Alphaproteobacteria bacterium]|jgi:hypothetical protein|nr:hypothetical protein [Thalassospira sp.]MCE2965431.1 hypothetical protein [Alphaproteobacteria bacterium]
MSIILKKDEPGLRLSISEAADAVLFEGYTGQNIKAEIDHLFTTVRSWRDAALPLNENNTAKVNRIFVTEILPEIEDALGSVSIAHDLKRSIGML